MLNTKMKLEQSDAADDDRGDEDSRPLLSLCLLGSVIQFVRNVLNLKQQLFLSGKKRS